jgi:hypothetical protein
MPIEAIIYMACWLAAAIVGGGVLVCVWQKLLARYQDRHARKEKVVEQSGAPSN